jgi:hypothetical protein
MLPLTVWPLFYGMTQCRLHAIGRCDPGECLHLLGLQTYKVLPTPRAELVMVFHETCAKG